MVLGRREFSVVLLGFGVVASICMVLLADPVSAQNQQNNQTAQQDSNCPGAKVVVDDFTGSGSKQTPPFNVTGNLFRVTSTVTSTANDPSLTGITIIVEDENGDSVTSVSQQGAGTDTFFINEGPGRFFLDVLAANAEYTIIVEDCTGSGQTDGGGGTVTGDQNNNGGDTTVDTAPNKPLPPTGGLPLYIYSILAGFILVGGSILTGLGIQREQRR